MISSEPTSAPFGRPLNVVRVISFLTVGGVQSMLLTTLPEFDRARVNLRVICTTRSGEVGDALVQRGVPVEVLKLSSRLGPSGICSLARRLRELRADVVHSHMYASNISATLAARLAGVPVIISHIHSEHEWRSRSRCMMDRFCDRFRAGNLAVSGAARDAFLRKTGLTDAARVRVLMNVPRPMSPSPATSESLRAELGIPAGAPVVGTVTRLAPVKGLDMLVRAARRVVDQIPDARFVLVGRGRERDVLLRQVAELGLEGRVILTGERLDVEGFYRMFDAFALTSHTEGCPNVILEAMRLGLPIASTRVGGVPELIRDGKNGLLAPDGDDAAMAEALIKLLADRELARRLAAQAKDDARDFTAPAYVGKMTAYYEELYARAKSSNRI